MIFGIINAYQKKKHLIDNKFRCLFFMSKIFSILLIVVSLTSYSTNVNSHSGRTNQEGCHVNTYTGKYHCHQSKYDNPLSINYCIVSNQGTFCGYSSYSSCYNAASSARMVNFQCMQR